MIDIRKEGGNRHMMISPETYYEEYLKGKTPSQIMTAIRGLKREISHLKNIIEHPDYQPTKCPSEDVQIFCCREYLVRAKQALIAAGGNYVPTQAELVATDIDENIPFISKIEFCIGGFFGGFETRTYTIYPDRICMDVEHSLILKPSNLGDTELEEIDREYFLECFRDLHIGEWRKNYTPRRFGFEVLDGTQWHLYVYFSNGHKPFKIEGSNDYPYNFDKLTELFNIETMCDDEE